MNAVVKTPGQQLKEAREEVGKTLSELAKTTRIGVSQLQGLEADDYSKIPAPMYVRGFIKLYAQELGLRHEPLIELYERMQNGESLVEKPEEPAVPAPVEEYSESIDSAPVGRTAPAGKRPAGKRPASKLPAVRLPEFRFNLEAIRAKLPEVGQILNSGWLQSPKLRIAAAVIVVLVFSIAGLRSCGGDAPSAESDLPEVEEPLLNQPDPVFFEVPRSYQ